MLRGRSARTSAASRGPMPVRHGKCGVRRIEPAWYGAFRSQCRLAPDEVFSLTTDLRCAMPLPPAPPSKTWRRRRGPPASVEMKLCRMNTLPRSFLWLWRHCARGHRAAPRVSPRLAGVWEYLPPGLTPVSRKAYARWVSSSAQAAQVPRKRGAEAALASRACKTSQCQCSCGLRGSADPTPYCPAPSRCARACSADSMSACSHAFPAFRKFFSDLLLQDAINVSKIIIYVRAIGRIIPTHNISTCISE